MEEMEKAIVGLPHQFDFTPVIGNESKLKPAQSYVVAGMGGSHLSADLLKIFYPSLNIYIHKDYGLPEFASDKSLFIASSYSGNTEEALDFAQNAFDRSLNLAIVAVGGKLLEFAKANNVPYIELPDAGIQPRSAIGLSFLALTRLILGEREVSRFMTLGKGLDPLKLSLDGKKLAEDLRGKIPVVYSSKKNTALAYNWKIKFNETAKIPAFHNAFPELNHNEMSGFDVIESTINLSNKFHFIFLSDSADNPKIIRRMEVCKKLYEDRGLQVTPVSLIGPTDLERIMNSLILADWTALNLSKIYGTEPSAVPIIEEFKKLIA